MNWVVYTDGAARGNPGPSASGFVVMGEHNEIVRQSGRYLGVATNNVAEYAAVLDALSWLVKKQREGLRLHTLRFYLDSLLVVQQLNGCYKVKHPTLKNLVVEIRQLLGLLPPTSFVHVPRHKNLLADAVVNDVLDQRADGISH